MVHTLLIAGGAILLIVVLFGGFILQPATLISKGPGWNFCSKTTTPGATIVVDYTENPSGTFNMVLSGATEVTCDTNTQIWGYFYITRSGLRFPERPIDDESFVFRFSGSGSVTNPGDSQDLAVYTWVAPPNFLSIRSSPTAATIIINGVSTGKTTPATIDLMPGEYIIELTRDGFVFESEPVTMNDIPFPNLISQTTQINLLGAEEAEPPESPGPPEPSVPIDIFTQILGGISSAITGFFQTILGLFGL